MRWKDLKNTSLNKTISTGNPPLLLSPSKLYFNIITTLLKLNGIYNYILSPEKKASNAKTKHRSLEEEQKKSNLSSGTSHINRQLRVAPI